MICIIFINYFYIYRSKKRSHSRMTFEDGNPGVLWYYLRSFIGLCYKSSCILEKYKSKVGTASNCRNTGTTFISSREKTYTYPQLTPLDVPDVTDFAISYLLEVATTKPWYTGVESTVFSQWPKSISTQSFSSVVLKGLAIWKFGQTPLTSYTGILLLLNLKLM